MSRTTLRLWLTAALPVVLGVAVLLGLTTPAAAPPPGTPPPAMTIQVRHESGEVTPLAPRGGGVVLVASATCGHCHTTMRAMAAAGDWPALRIVMLEGTETGLPVVRGLGLAAETVGPATTGSDVLSVLGVYGTPTFLHLDAHGREISRYIGALSPEVISRWRAAAGGV